MVNNQLSSVLEIKKTPRSIQFVIRSALSNCNGAFRVAFDFLEAVGEVFIYFLLFI